MFTVLVLSVSFAVIVSALCSVCEAALYSITVPHVELMAENYPQQAQGLRELKKNVEQPITAILTLNTIANTIGASVAGAAAVAVFGPNSLVWFSIVFTLVILLFSEILPKTVGVVYARQLGPHIVRPLQVVMLFLTPIIRLCQAVTRLVPQRENAQQVSAEEVKTIASLSRQTGAIEESQEQVITNILQLSTIRVRQAMTPRTVIFSLDGNLTVAEANQADDKLRMHSRIPVYDKEKDNVIGMVLSQDILMASAIDQAEMKLTELMHKVHFVPETAQLDRVFIDFFDLHQHLFVVVDEYGFVTGIISMEDVIEKIVGREIVDESDTTKSMRELAMRKNRLRATKAAAQNTEKMIP